MMTDIIITKLWELSKKYSCFIATYLVHIKIYINEIHTKAFYTYLPNVQLDDRENYLIGNLITRTIHKILPCRDLVKVFTVINYNFSKTLKYLQF
jgi:hypothetical protein